MYIYVGFPSLPCLISYPKKRLQFSGDAALPVSCVMCNRITAEGFELLKCAAVSATSVDSERSCAGYIQQYSNQKKRQNRFSSMAQMIFTLFFDFSIYLGVAINGWFTTAMQTWGYILISRNLSHLTRKIAKTWKRIKPNFFEIQIACKHGKSRIIRILETKQTKAPQTRRRWQKVAYFLNLQIQACTSSFLSVCQLRGPNIQSFLIIIKPTSATSLKISKHLKCLVEAMLLYQDRGFPAKARSPLPVDLRGPTSWSRSLHRSTGDGRSGPEGRRQKRGAVPWGIHHGDTPLVGLKSKLPEIDLIPCDLSVVDLHSPSANSA